MSLLLLVEDVGNILETKYTEPIRLNPKNRYELALRGFFGCNSIRNIHKGNDKFHYIDQHNEERSLHIPHGSYEIVNIEKYLWKHVLPMGSIELKANNSTQQCELKCVYTIDFSKEDSIGRMLGFEPIKYNPNITHMSELDVRIVKHTNVYIECNIITGSFRNNMPARVLHGFSISVEPGFSMCSVPTSPIYLEVNVDTIHTLELRLVDQKGELIDFGDEQASVILELKDNGPKL